jgi:hypothetical protein
MKGLAGGKGQADVRHGYPVVTGAGDRAVEADLSLVEFPGEGAGHGVAVLLQVYAHYIDGQADAANQRITEALGTTEPEPGDEEDADSEQAF